jgi:hypothetical protein
MAELTEVAQQCYDASEANGWHKAVAPASDAGYMNEFLSTKMMLIVSEVSESQDELRNGLGPEEIYYGEGGKPEGVLVELADVVIRTFDLVGIIGATGHFEDIIREKLAYNATRGKMHGGKLF